MLEPRTAGLIALALVGAGHLQAATLSVDPIVEIAADGQCALIEALVNADNDAAIHGDCPAGTGADRLILSPNFDYALTQPWNAGHNGLPRLRDDLEIVGRGATIGRRSGTPAFRLFELDGGDFIFSDLNLLNGLSSGSAMVGGGGLWIRGGAMVDLIDTVLEANRAEGLQSFGGAIRIDASELTLIDSRLSANSAISTSPETGGGAIAQFDGELLIQRSALLDNAADVPLNPSAPDNFFSTGGAIRIEATGSGATARIEDSTVAGNIGNVGGAIHLVAIANTGAIPADILVELVRSTVVRNDANSLGDGIYVQQANGGDGLVLYGSSILIGNGIEIAGQIIGSDCLSNFPSQDFFSSDGNVLAEDGDCTTFGFDALAAAADSVVNLTRNVDHYLPLPGGPAVDFSEANINCPLGSTDQLDKLRANGPGAGNADCDAGAIELYLPITNRILDLTLTGAGSGRVTSLPAGIDCPGTCSASFPDSVSVELFASADGDSDFTGWGGSCSGSGACVVDMAFDRQVSAGFELLPVTLNVLVDAIGGAGGTVQSTPVGILCPGDCSQSYPVGSQVTLVASPDPDSQFVSWGGACAPQSGPVCTLQMNGPRTASVLFQPDPGAITFRLDVQLAGTGTVVDIPGEIQCPFDCSGIYAEGTAVELLTNAPAGWRLQNFTGDCSGSSCSIVMDRDRSVGVIFIDDDAVFIDGFE